MKAQHWIFLPSIIFLTCCSPGESKEAESKLRTGHSLPKAAENLTHWERTNPKGKTIESRIALPPGFQRLEVSSNSIGSFLRKLPVKADGAPVLLFNGSEKLNQEAQVAVVDMEIGKRDLQQCADAVMRLRAEYLFSQKKFDQIHFNFTSGDRADFNKYTQGYRAVINGDKVNWQKKAASSNSYKTFRKYLDLVFTYAGTASLEKELMPVKDLNDVQPGDVLIQGGHPGHAVMVMDVAQHPETMEKVYLLSQSYMPAQEIHILKNPSDASISPWYSSKATGVINTPEWPFNASQLKRFPNW